MYKNHFQQYADPMNILMFIHRTLFILLEMLNVLSFTTLKCAIMTKGIVVTTLELLMESVMTETIIDSVNLMEETAALD